MLPKNDGAITMNQDLPRHLSRICFFLEDKIISPKVPQHSQGNIKRLAFPVYFFFITHVFS